MIKNKKNIDGIIVVEGKTDKDKILSLYNANVICTNGSALNNELFLTLKTLSKTNKIILFLDPDYVGEKIRNKIFNNLNIDNIYQCYITKNDIKNNSTKIGVAEATNESIINALNNLISFKKNNQSLSLLDYHNLNLNTKQKRLNICNKLKISYCNYKQLYKKLNMMNVDKNFIKELLNKNE